MSNWDIFKDATFKHSCVQCGYCCRVERLGLYPYEVWQVVRHGFFSQIQHKISNFVRLYGTLDHFGIIPQFYLIGKGGYCPFLRKMDSFYTCPIYSHRFLVCRTFPFQMQTVFKAEKGEDIKLAARNNFFFKKCPALGSGNEQKVIDLFMNDYAKEEYWYQEKLAIFGRAALFEKDMVKQAWLSLWFQPDLQSFYVKDWKIYREIAFDKIKEIYEIETERSWPETHLN